MADVALALLWHHHQPYYPDDVGATNPMPWVRLHGVKDYYGMALHLLECPEMRCTVNLVPSLVRQLEGYAQGATDEFLLLSQKPADGLTEDDCLFLLDHFFLANAEQMIRPYPRYAELHHRRGAGRSTARQVLRRFHDRDFRDLQVWFNLTWVHPLAFDQDPSLRALRDKDRHYTEEDKAWLLSRHREILNQVLPLYRQLAERGQVELTTTPYYHPILPLLLDKKLAREALPGIKLPFHTGGYPEDAAEQVRRAVAAHTQAFGTPPRGLWPAEGSVCHAMVPVLAQHGLRWFASDEDVLAHSLPGQVGRDERGRVRNPEALYRPYRVAEGSDELTILFRDKELSDLLFFHYQRKEPQEAAADFAARLQAAGAAVPGPGPALVSVILDGENCWESYPEGGVPFLRALYQRCTRTPGVRPVPVSEYLARHPATERLPRLFAGSWLRHSFAIWIGHEEDNTAWDALHRTREYLREKGRGGEGERGRQGDKETGRGEEVTGWQGDRVTGGGEGERGRQGDKETGRQGDRETGRQGDRETGRQGDRETGRGDRGR